MTRKESVTSITSESEDGAKDGTNEMCENKENSFTHNFVQPLDDIIALTQKIFDNKRQIKSAQMNQINNCINEMKNRVINTVLPLVNPQITNLTSVSTQLIEPKQIDTFQEHSHSDGPLNSKPLFS